MKTKSADIVLGIFSVLVLLAITPVTAYSSGKPTPGSFEATVYHDPS